VARGDRVRLREAGVTMLMIFLEGTKNIVCTRNANVVCSGADASHVYVIGFAHGDRRTGSTLDEGSREVLAM
jgi:hypothetical protein